MDITTANSGLTFALAAAAATVALGGAILAARQAQRRREAFAAAAAAHGWTYQARDDSHTRSWSGDPFGRGHNRQAHNVLTGHHDGRPFAAFDYVYYTTETSTDSTGNTRRREVPHWSSVVALTVGARFPDLTVRPEGAVGRFFGRITNTDIQFESDAFNRAFTVTCPDRKFASDVLHPRMMDLLLTRPDAAFRFDRESILSVHGGRHTVEQVLDRLDLLDQILDNIPGFVWDTPPAPGD